MKIPQQRKSNSKTGFSVIAIHRGKCKCTVNTIINNRGEFLLIQCFFPLGHGNHQRKSFWFTFIPLKLGSIHGFSNAGLDAINDQ